ncbi:hypothetical protein DYBT9275_02414 [Dyadobacter sp. CECT 9275]|uniref:Xylose isomerase-like TIM barrel domain-containing protein n=1 Tax=Dyadobacter helix TaxID=2822344 RepID=A0A916JFL3_9BACT|nr:TIM barrel protein [Dyadobacter sp. CECT 9275]CAG5000202.1 hypothetical protein DYBT9275_02414 [Dyadobacter sp. CECT 9275]
MIKYRPGSWWYVRLTACCLMGLLSGTTTKTWSQQIKNEFFPLHNIIRGDSVYDTYSKQVALIKNAGYDGIEISQIDSFEGMKAALDQHHFKGSYFYVKLNVEDPYIDHRLEGYIQRLKGSGTIIAPFVTSDSKKYTDPVAAADSIVISRIGQIGQWAHEAGLQVAIYPHYRFYVQHIKHSLDLVRKINQNNVGTSFNLCHWLATTPAGERKSLRADLKTIAPYLKLVTLCGANDVISAKRNVWDDYILPLGTGDFDTYGLLSYIIQELHYKGPVGAQCYNIKGPKPELVRTTMQAWLDYKDRLKSEK